VKHPPLPLFVLLCLSAALAPAQPFPAKVKPSAPVKDFRLPAFDQAGKRTTFMKAGEALFVTPTQIDVKDMHFTLFTKDGTGAFDSVLIAPAATFLTDQQIVFGRGFVRLLRTNIEVTGEQWSYHHAEKRVLIGNNVKFTFQDELKDIIK
jgi:lipopolysaccharide assembly outer membrane protein LptD (OstA)